MVAGIALQCKSNYRYNGQLCDREAVVIFGTSCEKCGVIAARNQICDRCWDEVKKTKDNPLMHMTHNACGSEITMTEGLRLR
jgi:hypothetical protein